MGNIIQTVFNSLTLIKWLKWEVITWEEKIQPLLCEDEPVELRWDGSKTWGLWGSFDSQHTPMSHQPHFLTKQTRLNAQGLLPSQKGLEKPIPAQGHAQGWYS